MSRIRTGITGQHRWLLCQTPGGLALRHAKGMKGDAGGGDEERCRTRMEEESRMRGGGRREEVSLSVARGEREVVQFVKGNSNGRIS